MLDWYSVALKSLIVAEGAVGNWRKELLGAQWLSLKKTDQGSAGREYPELAVETSCTACQSLEVGFLLADHRIVVVVGPGMLAALAAEAALVVDPSTGGDESFLLDPAVGSLNWVKTQALMEHEQWKLLAAMIVSEHP